MNNIFPFITLFFCVLCNLFWFNFVSPPISLQQPTNAVIQRIGNFKRVGVFLSSGLDSTTVCYFLSKAATVDVFVKSYTSVPCYLSSHDNEKKISEKHLFNIFLNNIGNISRSFHDFPEARFEAALHSNSLPNLFYPVIHSNSFWIEGILKKAKEDGIELMMTGQMGNYSISFKGDYPSLQGSLRQVFHYLKFKLFGEWLFQKQHFRYSIVKSKLIKELLSMRNRHEMILGFSYHASLGKFRKKRSIKFTRLPPLIGRLWPKNMV